MTAPGAPAHESLQRARARARYLAGLAWHAGAFMIINVFFWILDLTVGQRGVQWAFWISLLWGFALAFHALAYLVAGRQLEARKTAQYFAQEHADQEGPASPPR